MLDQQYTYAILQNGSIPLAPDDTRDRTQDHRCNSVLIWPAGQQPHVGNTVLVDPCFTSRGYRQALEGLARLDLSFSDVGQVFVTHRHGDHMLRFPFFNEPPGFTRFSADGPLAGIYKIPCPGHAQDLQALFFCSSEDQVVWVAGDAVLNLEWLKAWRVYWPNGYSPAEIVQTWESLAKILSNADLVLPGHGPPITVTASLLQELLSSFSSAPHAGDCQGVEEALADRLEHFASA